MYDVTKFVDEVFNVSHPHLSTRTHSVLASWRRRGNTLRSRYALSVAPFTQALTCHVGKDATDAFEDVGHSDEARELLPGMLVGEFEKDGVSFFFSLVTT